MESDILQNFLDQGLLNIGEEVDKFDYLKKAAADLAEHLKSDRRSLITAASVLLGGTLPESDPIFAQCAATMKKHWPTYRARFQSDVHQLYRAMLLQAMVSVASEQDISYAAIAYYTAAGLLPYLGTSREDAIFREFLVGLGSRVEAAAASVWGGKQALEEPKYDDPVASLGINVKWLTEHLNGAGNTAAASGTNPHAPNSNPAEWMNFFAKGAAEAVATAVYSVVKDMSPKIVNQVRGDIQKSVAAAVAVAGAENLRADVLYWKEALYSPSKQTSYRQMAPDNVVYWAAHDLHVRIPSLHPQSVEYFLRETVRAALGDEVANQTLTLVQLCESVAQHPEDIQASNQFAVGSRLTPLAAVQATADGKASATDAAAQTGIPPTVEIPRCELAVLLFRDFQAGRLAGG